MNPKQMAKQQLSSYLTQKGINTAKPFHCLNPEHPDKNPSMSFDRKRHKAHCFSCGADYDIFDVVAIDNHLDGQAEIFKRTYELLDIETPSFKGYSTEPKPPIKDYLARAAENLRLTDYPRKRGLSEKTCRRFKLGFDPSFKTGRSSWAALIIPTGPGSYTARNTDPKAAKNQRIRKSGASPVFNLDALWQNPDKPLLVVEGELDALCVYEAGGEAVALGSTANVRSFLQAIKIKPPLRPLVLALDNDDEGRGATENLTDGLKSLSVSFFTANPYGDAKDAGEALLSDPEAFSAALFSLTAIEPQGVLAEKEAYLASSAVYHLEAFRNPLGKANTPARPCGFKGLDQALDGGLYEGLYIVGGISSLGKTTLITQLGDQLAMSGLDVLIFSLEMARSELMAKSISRLTLLKALEKSLPGSLAKTARDISCGARYTNYSQTERHLINQAIESYAAYAGRLFIIEGGGGLGAAGIRLEVEKHRRLTGAAPVVLIDYLQILAPGSERAGDKQNTDKNVLELKRLSRDFKIPIIALSSFNRSSYQESVTMEAFKESGAIEYSSDVLLGLQLKGAGEKDFDALAEKARNPRRVELLILKNRQGPAGLKIDFEYYPMFNYFKEIV